MSDIKNSSMRTPSPSPASQFTQIGDRQCFGTTHTGLVRRINADRYTIHDLGNGDALLAIADGLGDTPAAANAADNMLVQLSSVSNIPFGEELNTLNRLARETDQTICYQSQHDPALHGGGSTLVAVLLRGQKAYWLHVGDSRLYLCRTVAIHQVTIDQTLARFLVAENEITSEQAAVHYSRHVMDQYIGCGFVEPETGELALMPSDLLMLSSDGLHNQVPEKVWHRILNLSVDLIGKGQALMEAVLEAGAADNATVVLFRHTPADGPF